MPELGKDKFPPIATESVAAILTRCKTSLIADWLERAKRTPELSHLELSDSERTVHLPRLIDDIIARLGKSQVPTKDNDAIASPATVEHGQLRRRQGYNPGMLIHESRVFQVSIFGTLHKNRSLLDSDLLLPDVMTIADEVDSQLTQTMDSFSSEAPESAKAKLVKPSASRTRTA
jgi:hypothetical protein